MISITYALFMFGIFVIIACILSNSDFSSPSFIYFASFFLCVGCSVVLAKEWGMTLLDINTFFVFMYSSITFLSIELIIRIAAKLFKVNSKNGYLPIIERHPIELSKSIVYFTIFLGAICILWSLAIILSYGGGSSWNSIMAGYKKMVNLEASSLGGGRMILSQINKVLLALNYVILYAYIYNNSIKKMHLKEKRIYLVSFAEYIIFRLLFSGGRQSSLFFLVAWLTCSYICNTYKKRKSQVKKEKRKYAKASVTVILIMIPLFYLVGRMVGRKESETIYEAASNYLSTGVYYFNIIVKNQYTSSCWGEVSFPGLFPILKFFDIIPKGTEIMSFLPFSWHGNTVTLLGRWYWDFGLKGVLLMTSLVSFIFNYIYYFKIKYAASIKENHFFVIIYIFLIHVLYFAGYDDFSFNIWTSNYLLIFILIYITFRFVVIHKLRIKIY
ncbi:MULTISPECIES: O-antigen polymerase [unclassified Clostridium]|uniref:O-antigen polymerase n=1 Tax=unclassified Clostridium TaxID=2614128 RepID=UPI000297429E|nr:MULTISPECIES: O-antigen polymerase [unclassified Clostridium]EKQ56966.1 MAG: hypothetical protein A370_01462 [Clostridium sp. Maddingley MBC34-26]